VSIAVTLLAIPVLAGPGTIATAMNFASTGGLLEMGITISAFALLCLIPYLFFVRGQRLGAFLRKGGLNVAIPIMGVISAVIGVQMLTDGTSGAIAAAKLS
jgi:multiple antibiotic resistance protein